MPFLISAWAISAWISEKPTPKSGFKSRIRSTLALVKAETRGFSRRARAGRTVKPEMPTIRSSCPSAYRTSVGSSVRQMMRHGYRLSMGCLKHALGQGPCRAVNNAVREPGRLRQHVVRIEPCRRDLRLIKCGVATLALGFGEPPLRDQRRPQQLPAAGGDAE